MLEYMNYINEILESNAKNNFLSSLFTYESEAGELSVYDLIEAYYSMLNNVDDKINNFMNNLIRLDDRLVTLFENMKIIIVSYDEDDNSYVFILHAETPISYNIKLRLRKLDKNEKISDIERNKRGELVLREDANNYSEYELSIVNEKEIYTLDFTIAALFYKNANDDLFDLLGEMQSSYNTCLIYTPKVDTSLPLSIELYNGEVRINYTDSNNECPIFHIDGEKILKIQNESYIQRLDMKLIPFSNDPIWFLKNIYVPEDNYMKEKLYNYEDNNILCNMFMKTGYGNTKGFRVEYCDEKSWASDEDRYFIRSDENKLLEIRNYSSVNINKDETTFTFTFLDDSTLIIPANEVIQVLPLDNNKEPMALLALRGRL